MRDTRDLLVEIGTEELPPKALRGLMSAFHTQIIQGLAEAGLDHGDHRAYATPRRLAVVANAVLARQPDQNVERRGPAVKAAVGSDGNPSKAAEGFARSCGVPVAELETLSTDKGEWLVYRGTQAGEQAEALIPGIIDRALAALPIPRRMRWGAGQVAFVRPVHWAVVLFGEAVIEMPVLGITSGRETRGHRFHSPASIAIESPDQYEGLLEQQGYVIADFERRKDAVQSMAMKAAAAMGGEAMIDPDLLDEVTALVEWPVAITGSFDERFLAVPAEALISSMQGHQKYFPVLGSDGRLLPKFITMANLQSRDPVEVARGNERVIRPRLADAEFFWTQDRKQPLADRIEGLKGIVFQQKLGSLYDKSVRVAALAHELAASFGVNADIAEQAAMLGKCDLLTEMVGEFPELQGVMGRYYAAHDGLEGDIPASLEEQYQPRFAGDTLPATALGQVLAVAERTDTLIGIFAIGQAPTGDKDPFALRRAALGLVRILVEQERRISLKALLKVAAGHQPDGVDGLSQVEPVFNYCMDRLKGYYLDQGFSPELFDAVRSVQIGGESGSSELVDDPVDFDRRLRACAGFQAQAAAGSLAAANKRVKNILRKAGDSISAVPDPALFEVPEEQALFDVVKPLAVDVGTLAQQGRYEEALARLADAREAVDAFFDQVMVMTDDEKVRRNRLALLTQLTGLFSTVADISRLPGS
ncbi:MAG: glycine--tRNA ligase subunit beta [Aquisalimonadaceae bacterium]